MGEVFGLIIGILGVSGIVFTALRWRRDDTTAVVGQQQVLFDEMRAITDNLRLELAHCEERVKGLSDA